MPPSASCPTQRCALAPKLCPMQPDDAFTLGLGMVLLLHYRLRVLDLEEGGGLGDDGDVTLARWRVR
eukprot:COSAG01_NODE_8242_length_2858_cov_29.822037_4_plen_67_part_00